MKIIDEKGKLFGKINIIDFLVILFLLCILPAFYFGYRILAKKPAIEPTERFAEPVEPAESVEPVEMIEVEVDCQLIKLKPEILKLISVGDEQLDEDGKVIGKILSLGESSPYKHEFNIGEGQKIVKADPSLREIFARLKLRAELKGSDLYYKGRQILQDSTINFETDRYQAEALLLFEDEVASGRSILTRQAADYVNSKITPLENKTVILENKTAILENKITPLENKTAILENKITPLENKTAILENKIKTLQEEVNNILSSSKIKELMKKR